MDFSLEAIAEDTILLRFGDRIDAAINARVNAAARALREAALPGIVDIAPAYASLLLRVDATAWSNRTAANSFESKFAKLQAVVTKALFPPLPHAASSHGGEGWGEGACPPDSKPERSFIEIPVCYGGDHGPDLEAVAKHAGLSPDAVVARHAGGEYTVAMLGFAPGFPYLLGLDAALHVPRRDNPRTRVPAGSVAIGGAQTGIYPKELPGGWHLIGRTPLSLFDAHRASPALLAPGDRVRFRAIDAAEFARLGERLA